MGIQSVRHRVGVKRSVADSGCMAKFLPERFAHILEKLGHPLYGQFQNRGFMHQGKPHVALA